MLKKIRNEKTNRINEMLEVNIQKGDSFCTGCGACLNICPKDSIAMKQDIEGFYFPVVNSELCVKCGLCDKVCPRTNVWEDNGYKQSYYAVAASDEIRLNSASGGVFTLAADYILKHSGIVCGAKYSDDFFSVYHTVIDKSEDLPPLKSSKYLQSDTMTSFRKIKSALDENRYAIFVGTPCQVAGLRNYLKLARGGGKRLFTLDLLCHATPSQKAWEMFLKETMYKVKEEYGNKYNNKNIVDISIISVNQRSKMDGWQPDSVMEIDLVLKMDDGTVMNHKIIGKRSSNDPWFSVFLKYNATHNKACYNCKYATKKRYGDLTIGDFWGVDKIIPEIDDKKGLSAVIVNNKQGFFLLKKILRSNKNNIKLYQKCTSIGNQRTLDSGWQETFTRTLFFNSLNRDNFYKAFDALENVQEKDKFDIGIAGWYYSGNLGDVLTTWALNEFLKSCEKCVLCISDPYLKEDDFSPFQKRNFNAVRKYYNMSCFLPVERLPEINKICRNYVVAGGQLWNNTFLRNRMNYYQLCFASNEAKKISCTPSFGLGYFDSDDNQEIETYKNNFMNFTEIFVREEEGVKILDQTFGIKSTKILDPVFFVNLDKYQELANDSNVQLPTEKYLFVYCLEPNEQIIKLIKEIVQQKRLQLIFFMATRNYEPQKHYDKMSYVRTFGIEPVDGVLSDWLKYIINCDIVFTDSFHCICLSLLFNKNFLVTSPWDKTANRFDILKTFELHNKVWPETEDISVGLKKLDYSITWDEINRKIREEADKDISKVKRHL
jgi:coenzyme F420-reducing hydrogenase beta subunit